MSTTPFDLQLEAIRTSYEREFNLRIEQCISEANADAGVVEALGIGRQSEVMLCKFAMEQLRASKPPGDLSRAVIDRDFGGLDEFHVKWQRCAENRRSNWIVFGLSFYDFAFRIYGVRDVAPFCVSPVLCWPLWVPSSQGADADFAYAQDAIWALTDWTVGEARIRCLTEPIDLFAEPTSCAENACASGS